MQDLPVSLEAAIAIGLLVAVAALGAVVHALRTKRRAAPVELAAEAPPPMPLTTGRVRGALAKTRVALRRRLGEVFGRDRELDAILVSLEEVLLAADVGIPTTTRILQTVRARCGTKREPAEADVGDALRGAIQEALGESTTRPRDSKPWVILVSGVNGVGKTTSIGKLAARFIAAGDRVLLVAADTFRAAAIDQLGVWAERVGADLVRHQSGADPAAVAFDGVKAAIARDVDVVIVDTAGRLHTRENLMEELRKVTRVIGKAIPGAPHEVWLVLDATTGQNAIHQAKVFSQALGVTGIVLTKLDGTAKGGAALAVRQELGVPIVWLGVGEGIEDIRPFSAAEFASALLGED
jgi:fused signal recognition particle receptor